MLKKFIQTALLLVVLFTTVQSYAQVSQAPDGIQFQALATDANEQQLVRLCTQKPLK